MRFFSVVSFFCFSSHTVQVNVLDSLLFVSLFTNAMGPNSLSCQVDPRDMHIRNNFYFRYKYLSLLKFRYKYLCLYKIRCLGFYKFIKIYINNFDIFDSRHFGTRHFCTLGVLVLDILVPILIILMVSAVLSQ